MCEQSYCTAPLNAVNIVEMSALASLSYHIISYQLDSLLFKLVTMPDKEAALLAIPEISVDKIIALYDASLFTGHQGVVKTYLKMKDTFSFHNLMHYLRSFTKGCHICQLARPDQPPMRQLQP